VRPPRADAAVLDRAGAKFAVGTNLKGEGAGAAWTFLLPSLEFQRVLCVGLPSASTLRTLSRLAAEVVVAFPRGSDRRHGWKRNVQAGTNVRLMAPAEAVASVPHAELAVVAGWRAAASLNAETELRRAVLGARMAFVDLGRPGRLMHSLARLRRVVAGFGPACTLRLTPRSGEVHTAGAEDDAPTLTYLQRVASADRPSRQPSLRGLVRRLRRLRYGGSRSGVLAARGAGPVRLTTPAYVGAIALAAGVVLDEHRVGLYAPSEYASRKAVLFLFRAQEPAPELVVKLTRDPVHNARLENEWRALSWLQETGLQHSGVLLRPAFFGYHAGLAVLGESAVAGAPFRQRTTARADCPLARRAMKWLLDLGTATAHPATDNRQVAAGLHELVTRFEELYRLTDAQHARLHRHVDMFVHAQGPLPLVLQHGDPGTWNLLVTNEGRPAFLDWEAAERHGLPLWDLFYFVRSFGVTVARAARPTSSLVAVRRQLLDDQPLNRLLVAAVERHCVQIGLDRELVEPLFVTCWMHRALKEAGRLPRERLDDGHYVNLVRLSLDEPDAPGLRCLFGAGGQRRRTGLESPRNMPAPD
jgi:hypothetical protein